MEIKKITDPAFRKYGRVVQGVDFTQLLKALEEKTPLPEGVAYEPSVAALEETDAFAGLQNVGWGEHPIQIGYCNGHNHLLNAVEYHRNSEINIGGTDAVLLLGLQQDITDDFQYDTSKMEAFLLPKGVGVEIYGTTLHYAPISATPDGGFKVVIVLPKGTNYDLEEKHDASPEDKLLAAKNKWLIGHAEGGLPEGSFIGLVGENIYI